MRRVARALLPLAVVLLAACVGGEDEPWVTVKAGVPMAEVFHFTGIVDHLDLEGGLFVIRDDDGAQYQPIHLPEAFRVKGLRVEAETVRRDDVASIGMVGPLVEVIRIRKMGDP